MKSFNKILGLSAALFLLPLMTLAYDLPTGTPWTTTGIMTALNNAANFMLAFAIAGAIIIIIYAGIIYLSSGFNPKAVESAKGVLKYAIYGVAIVLAAGIIINTVAFLVTGNFFGIGTSNTGNSSGLPSSGQTQNQNSSGQSQGSTTTTKGDIGSTCSVDDNCLTGLHCGNNVCSAASSVVKGSVGTVGESCNSDNTCDDIGVVCNKHGNFSICDRSQGNETGEGCLIGSDCNSDFCQNDYTCQ
ncbi:MAG: hypothetical protein ABR875_04175 [Minisyncoccia bacterium]|jgi:hypothetical protein